MIREQPQCHTLHSIVNLMTIYIVDTQEPHHAVGGVCLFYSAEDPFGQDSGGPKSKIQNMITSITFPPLSLEVPSWISPWEETFHATCAPPARYSTFLPSHP